MIKLMKHRVHRWLLNWLLAAAFVIGSAIVSPGAALAQDEEKIYDARLEGYPGNVTLESRSTALMWLLLVVLAALCVGVMFKNARRTHLD